MYLSIVIAAADARTLQDPERWQTCETGPGAVRERDAMSDIVVGVDGMAVERRALYHLERLRAADVVLVRDPRVCARAAREYYRWRVGPPARQGVVVLRIGDGYAVLGAERAGEWTILARYDRDWRTIVHVLR